MPANRRQQDREEKRAELLAAARRLFIENGYEATSMAALAKAAGVAGNTIYWYFADKDDVLIAVLDAVLSDALAEYEQVASAWHKVVRLSLPNGWLEETTVKNAPAQVVKLVRMTTGGKQVRRQLSRAAA